MNEEAKGPNFRVAGSGNAERPCLANVYHADVGDLIDGYQLLGQLDVVSAEADLWVAQKNGQEFVCKLYRHGVTSSLVSSGTLLALDNPHLLPTKATGEHLGRQYEIAPFCSGGNLEKLLASGEKMDLADAELLLGQLTSALSYLHGQGIQHRDIKPANILLRQLKPLEVVMSDFGQSEEGSATMLTMSRTTLLYSAPEAVNGMFSAASDWWSIGMVLLECIQGRHPLSHLPARQQQYAIVAGHIPIPENLPERWQFLLRGLLTGDHTQRWMGDQVMWWLQQTQNATPVDLPASTLDRKHGPSLLTLVMIGIPLLLIATRFLGPIVEEFLGAFLVLWLVCVLGVLLWKMAKGK
ncbi:MAG: protein kinase [Verrucomicrobiota bacterium]